VLAVSYGGPLNLFGYKGTPLPKATTQKSNGGFGSFGNLGHSSGTAKPRSLPARPT
jgi:hypothetical protein